MGWFNKKKEDEVSLNILPELPELPKSSIIPQPSQFINEEQEMSPDFPEFEINELPPLPETAEKRTYPITPDQPMQKSNFTYTNQIEEPPVPFLPSPQKPQQVQQKPTQLVQPKPVIQKTPTISDTSPKKIEPIYIRLDKFESSVETLEEIKEKITEIENFLVKSREIKNKEEEELIDWENEIQDIKSKIDSIDKNLLDKLD